MTRHSQLSRLVALGGFAAAGALALSAVPAGATIVCPNGIQPPSPYCTNVPPKAKTQPATKITSTSAQLNGRVGPDVRGGDITHYYFEYGRTRFYFGRTLIGTVGACPPGIDPPSPYCTVPKAERVSADISGLTPCTNYHFRVVAFNPDGFSKGADETFTTDCRHRPPHKHDFPRHGYGGSRHRAFARSSR
jgi:hypothetical protein